MQGLYIHIPFCKSRCIYCGFYSTTGMELRQRYVEDICREIAQRPAELSTIYLGGGTPSQLTTEQLQQIFDTIYIYNKVDKAAEVTIEVNPDDVTPDFAQALSRMPVNRVSMGVQTFRDERLKFLHRRHSAFQAKEVVERLRDAGIKNISIDLMYGFPEEDMKEWENDIKEAISLKVEHLSAYCLMIEEGTPLYRMNTAPIDEELERQMYDTLIDHLEGAGYEHYEISNFAQPGYRSRHNSSYWNGTPYIGIGAAAHSYDGQTRRWNVANIRQYMEGIESGALQYEEEAIDYHTRYNDQITVALRTKEGLDLKCLSEEHRNYCMKNAERFLDNGLLRQHDDHLILTREGLFVSDMIMSELIWID